MDYEILSGDTLVALWKNNELQVLNEQLLPLYLKKIHNADMWLETRAIDSHRANSRLIKKAIRLTERDDLSTVLKVNGATITDNYWVRPISSDLSYKDIHFNNDYFSTLALKGSYRSFNYATKRKTTHTQELTNTGSFEKCWKLSQNGDWWMYKKANHDELFSEVFIYELGVKLGFNMAVYEKGDGYVKSLDFTHGNVNFEPASSFMGDNEDYEDVVEALNEICPQAIPDYIKMIFMDTIIANPDRHTNNFGLLRDKKSGELLGLAPNFDNNMALISRGPISKQKSRDMLVSLFKNLMEYNPEYKQYIPTVTEEVITEVLRSVNMKVKSKEITEFIMMRYKFIKE